MWQLDTTQQTYTPNYATHWTWAKVSASALKYLKSRHSNVPSFIPLISSGKNKNKYDTTVYELGRELHKLTRYAFDKLKENPNSNIKDLFHTISKGNNKSRNIVKFGNEGNDKHDEKEILNVIDEFRNEHYNNMINTLRVDLNLCKTLLVIYKKIFKILRNSLSLINHLISVTIVIYMMKF